MNAIIALFCIIVGILAMFCGGWCAWEMIVHGITMCVDGAKANPTNAVMIVKGIFLIIVFEMPLIVGFILGLLCFRAGLNQK
jgi:hypothetical protein